MEENNETDEEQTIETSQVEIENVDKNYSTNNNIEELTIEKDADLGSLKSEGETPEMKKKKKKKRKRKAKENKEEEENLTLEKELDSNADIINVEIKENSINIEFKGGTSVLDNDETNKTTSMPDNDEINKSTSMPDNDETNKSTSVMNNDETNKSTSVLDNDETNKSTSATDNDETNKSTSVMDNDETNKNTSVMDNDETNKSTSVPDNDETNKSTNVLDDETNESTSVLDNDETNKSTSVMDNDETNKSTSVMDNDETNKSTSVMDNDETNKSTSVMDNDETNKNTSVPDNDEANKSTSVMNNDETNKSTSVMDNDETNKSTSVMDNDETNKSTSVTDNDETNKSTSVMDNDETNKSTSVMDNDETNKSTSVMDNDETNKSTSVMDNDETNKSTSVMDNDETNKSTSAMDNDETNKSTSVMDNDETNKNTSVMDNDETNKSTSVMDNETNKSTSVMDNDETNKSTSVMDNDETNKSTNVTDNDETNKSTSVTDNDENNKSTSVTNNDETNKSTSVMDNDETNKSTSVTNNDETNKSTNDLKNKINEEIKKNNLPLKLLKEKDYFEVPGEEIVGGTYTRVVIIGDSFVLDYSKLWPEGSKIKPFFLYKNKLSADELFVKFREHPFLKNSRKILVLFLLGLHDFADYGTFLKASCTGNHLFTEYLHDGKNLNTLQCWRYIQKLLDTKENFELVEHLSVSFSYFPELKNIRKLRTIFNAVPEDIPNCTCLCRSLGDLPGKMAATHFGNTVFNINGKLSVKQLNSTKDKSIFEYMPPTVSFINGNWRLTRPRECTQDDVMVLSFLLREHVYGDECVNVSNEPDEVKRLMAIMRARIWRCKFRFIFMGDTWIDFIARQWPLSSKIVPYFYFAENLTLNDFCKVIVSLIRKEEIGLVITAVPSGELFTMKSSSCCQDHKPLEYPVPNENILQDPVNYANQLIGKINKFLEETKQLRQHCGVVFTTCYPVQFAPYYDHISKAHSSIVGETIHPDSDSVIDVDFADFDKKLSRCLEIINQFIISSHRKHKLPLCNIYNLVNSARKEFAFPTYIESKSPSKPIRKDLLQCIRNYVTQFHDLCSARKLTFTHTEEYIKKEVDRRRKVWKKKKYKNEMYRRREEGYYGRMNRSRKVTAPLSAAEMCLRMQKLNISRDSRKFPFSSNPKFPFNITQGSPLNNRKGKLIPVPVPKPSSFNQPSGAIVPSPSIISRTRSEQNGSPQSFDESHCDGSLNNNTKDALDITTGSHNRVSSVQN